jgi:glycosyltransferase involved in cell wall biosynthesis
MIDIILTVHNKEDMVARVIESIKRKTVGEYNLIIVLDGCTDNSEIIVKDTVKDILNHKILHQDNVFETKANNAGIREGSANHIAIIQDDMVIFEEGWDQRMLEPFLAFDDVFAVTSKTAHDLIIDKNSFAFKNGKTVKKDGWCDLFTYGKVANRHNTPRNIFSIRGTVNRGPLMVDRKKIETLGLFDESFAPQNMDDHELCTRARKEHDWVCGLYWIDFLDDPENSTTKTHDASRTPQWLYNAQTKNTWTTYERHKEFLELPVHYEERNLL